MAVAISVTTKGDVSHDAVELLDRHLRRLAEQMALPMLSASATLIHHRDPARERPVQASATIELNGHWERASVEASEEVEAVDLLDAKLRRIVTRYNERRQRKGRLHVPSEGGEGHWRHGDLPTRRAPWPELPDEERTIVERALYGPESRTVAEAEFDLEALGQTFTLFVDEGTGQDSLLCKNGDGSLELVQLDPPDDSGDTVVLEVAAAIEQLILTGHQLVLFRSAQTGRGSVVYHRRDGHYGLVQLGIGGGNAPALN